MLVFEESTKWITWKNHTGSINRNTFVLRYPSIINRTPHYKPAIRGIALIANEKASMDCVQLDKLSVIYGRGVMSLFKFIPNSTLPRLFCIIISQSAVKYKHTFEYDILERNKESESLIVTKGDDNITIAFVSCWIVETDFSFIKTSGIRVILGRKTCFFSTIHYSTIYKSNTESFKFIDRTTFCWKNRG